MGSVPDFSPRAWRRPACRLAAGAGDATPARPVGQAARDESGAALVLALVFLVVGALSLTALVSFAGSALRNTANLKAQRALEYAANGATDLAIQAVRYRPRYFGPGTPVTHGGATGAPATADCLGPASATIGGVAVSVDCSGHTSSVFVQHGPGSLVAGSAVATSAQLFSGAATTATFVGYAIGDSAGLVPPGTTIVAETNAVHTATMSAAATGSAATDVFALTPTAQRTVTFLACRAGAGACTGANAVVRAVVSFNDLSAAGSYACNATTSQSCGTSMAVVEWIVTTANH